MQIQYLHFKKPLYLFVWFVSNKRYIYIKLPKWRKQTDQYIILLWTWADTDSFKEHVNRHAMCVDVFPVGSFATHSPLRQIDICILSVKQIKQWNSVITNKVNKAESRTVRGEKIILTGYNEKKILVNLWNLQSNLPVSY